jgi:nucleoid DNA-binding protein
MIKADLVARMMQDAELTTRQAEKVLDVFLDSIRPHSAVGKPLPRWDSTGFRC